MAEELRPGLVGEAEIVCGPEHLASRFGAPGIDVFATPIMVGLEARGQAGQPGQGHARRGAWSGHPQPASGACSGSVCA